MIDISLFNEKLSNFELDLPFIFERSDFSEHLYEVKKFSFTAPQDSSLPLKNISQLLFSQISNIIYEQFIKSVVTKLNNIDLSYIDLSSSLYDRMTLSEKNRFTVNKIIYSLQMSNVKCVMVSPRINVEYFSDSPYFSFHSHEVSLLNSYFSQTGKIANLDVFVIHTLNWQSSVILTMDKCRFDLKDFEIKFSDGQFFISYKSYFEFDNPKNFQILEDKNSDLYRTYIASKRNSKIDKLLSTNS
jgi:hypothetical protein